MEKDLLLDWLVNAGHFLLLLDETVCKEEYSTAPVPCSLYVRCRLDENSQQLFAKQQAVKRVAQTKNGDPLA